MTSPDITAPVVLIIDDDEVNRIVLGKLFKREGIETILAENGLEGIQYARNSPPDMILLDIFMPGDDGFHILSQLKDDRNLSRIPVCIFSILEDKEKIEKAYSLGACAYITKPFDMKETVAKVKEIIHSGSCTS